MTRPIASLGAMLLCGASLVAMQSDRTPSQGATFRAGTALVEVDVIARDKDGHFVSGLTAEDFEVLEEGRPQQIQHFYLVTPSATARSEPKWSVMMPRAPDQTDRRVFLFFYDSAHLAAANIARVKQAAMGFVGENLGPRDLAGVFTNGSLWHSHLSSDPQEVLDGIRSAAPSVETSATRRGQLVEYPRIDSELDATRIEAGDQKTLDGIADKNCVMERDNCAMEGGREYVVFKLQRKAINYVGDARRAASETLSTLSYLSRNLAGLEGRKTIVMFSEGFFAQDVRGELQMLAGRASRAGVTIYTIDPRGTSVVGGRTVADASVSLGSLSLHGDTADEGLDTLAIQTGGVAIRRTDDLAGALRTVADDTSTYYVLAYAPQNTALDGTFRRIELKTTWKGLTLRARQGYLATPLPPPRPTRTGR